MAFSHYVDVMIRDQSIAIDLHARLLSALHGVISRHEIELAASWPDWQSRSGEFGSLFRAFGDEAGLQAFLTWSAPLVDAGLVRSYPVAVVPNTLATIAYLRDRRTERQTPGFSVRQARRQAKRHGHEVQSIELDQSRQLGLSHHLKLQSSSTKQTYCFFIRQVVNASQDAGGKAYGLGYTLPNF